MFKSGWWFGTWILWLSIYWEESSQLTIIFFRGVETTNQKSVQLVLKFLKHRKRSPPISRLDPRSNHQQLLLMEIVINKMGPHLMFGKVSGKVNHNSHACWDRETPLSMKCAGDLTSICLRNGALAVEVPSAITRGKLLTFPWKTEVYSSPAPEGSWPILVVSPGEVYHAGRDLASPSAKDCGHSFWMDVGFNFGVPKSIRISELLPTYGCLNPTSLLREIPVSVKNDDSPRFLLQVSKNVGEYPQHIYQWKMIYIQNSWLKIHHFFWRSTPDVHHPPMNPQVS